MNFFKPYKNCKLFNINGWIFTIVILALLTVRPAFGLPNKNITPILSQLEKHILTQVQKKQIAGCAVAVVYQNEVVFLRTYGVKAMGKQDKIDPDTVFQLGSVSKPLAATLASILENKGLLRLEDPVNRYLPDFSLNTAQPSNVLKVKHILSHSTGVPRAGFNNLIEAYTPYNHILRKLQRTPVRSTVGKRYDYHNAMFSLISEITTAATRLTFKDALSQNLLKPLNMSRTSATLEGLLRTPNRATPHTRGRRGALTPCESYSKGYYNVAPAGGINSSIKDMAIFLKAQMGGYPQVLNARVLNRIQTPHVATKSMLSPFEGPPHLIRNARYGLGWRIVDFDNYKMIFHGGWVKGFTNFIGFIPEHGIGIVVLQNAENKFSSKTAMKFFELYMDVPKRRNSLMPPRKRKETLFKRRKLEPILKKSTIANTKTSLTPVRRTLKPTSRLQNKPTKHAAKVEKRV